MAYLSAFARASGITTPASKDRTPSSTNSTSTPEPEHPLDRRTMSPIKRTQQWVEGPTPKKDSNAVNLHKVKGSRITKSPSKKEKRKSFWSLELLSNFFGKEQKEETMDDLEGVTYVEDDEPLPTIEHDHDFTLVEDYEDEDKAANTKRALKDFNDRYLDYNDPRIKEWTDEEIWLFNKLQKRGAEPLLISTWTLDFSTFPDQLFSQDENQVFINNIHTSSGHGRQLALPSLLKISANLFLLPAAAALTKLISAGSYVDGQKVQPERPLLRELNAYYKWTLQDGKLHNKEHIPNIAIASAKPRETVESVVSRLTDQLHSLGRQYREKWRHPKSREHDHHQVFLRDMPTLFGFVIKYSVVAIVTCDSSIPRKPIRTLITCDWKITGQGVWHALAVAITMVRARNYLMQLNEEGELGDDIEDSDPDL